DGQARDASSAPSPTPMQPKILAIQKQLQKTHPESSGELELLGKVEAFTRELFAGKKRLSGKEYHEDHNLSVAQIVAVEMELGLPEICVAILHDVLEETPCTRQDIVRLLEGSCLDGNEIARMVDGLSKIGYLEEEINLISDVEYIRKLMAAVSEDLRTLVIKIADVIHNTRDLRSLPRYRQKRFAMTNLEIWSWLCMRFGMGRYFRELARHSLWAIDPKGFSRVQRQIAALYSDNLEKIYAIRKEIESSLGAGGVSAHRVIPLMRHVHSRLLKERTLKDLREVRFRKFSDLVDFEIILSSRDEMDCYRALGILHRQYRAIPGEFHDYISESKYNLYSALHTKAVREEDILNLRILTREMKRIGEDGVVHFLARKEGMSPRFEAYQRLLKQLKEENEIEAFMGHLKDFLVPEDIVVMTPKRDLVYLPAGSTVLDFAFQIHTELGLRVEACSINGEAASIFSELRSGDRVEVFPSPQPCAKVFWREHVQTPKARLALQTHAHRLFHQLAAQVGHAILEQNVPDHEAVVLEWIEQDRARRREEDLFGMIGTGELTLTELLSQGSRPQARKLLRDFPVFFSRWIPGYREARPRISISLSQVGARFDPCCPNGRRKEGAIGHLENYSVVVHDPRCKTIDPRAQERSFMIEWAEEEETYSSLVVSAEDQPGVVASITSLLFARRINIKRISSKEKKGLPEIHFVLNTPVIDRQLMDELKNLPGVIHVHYQGLTPDVL
ncbi:MAG: HD domain-containing protein, partial [bacterium]